MSQSSPHFAELLDSVVGRVVEALTGRASITPERRDADARMVRALIEGLGPLDVRQLMLAGHAVLFHALTLDAAADVRPSLTEAEMRRARTSAVGLSRMATRNLDGLSRAHAGKQAPAPRHRDDLPTLHPAFEQLADAAPTLPAPPPEAETPAPSPPLNRQQKRWAEREYARLARRAAGHKNAGAQCPVSSPSMASTSARADCTRSSASSSSTGLLPST